MNVRDLIKKLEMIPGSTEVKLNDWHEDCAQPDFLTDVEYHQKENVVILDSR